jgi:hypothetical protein
MMAPSLKSPNGLSDTAAETTFTAIRTVTEALFTRPRPASNGARASGLRAAPLRGRPCPLLKLGRGLLAGTAALALLAACVSLPPRGAPVGHLAVRNPRAQGGTGRTYDIGRAAEGARAYSDRTQATVTLLPQELRGSTWIRSADGDRAASAGSPAFLTFDLLQSSTVYVAHDIRIVKKPDWLTREFMDTGLQLRVASDLFELYSNVYPEHASVALGSNLPADGEDRNHMYLVFVVPTASDHEPPTPPASVEAVCASAAVVGLSWMPSADNVGVAGYRVMRGGVPLGTTASTYFSDTTVAASTPYTYTVSAFDGAGNTAASTPLLLTTPASSATGDAPYCSSRVIGGMNWQFSNGYTEPNGSDLWPAAWGADGNVYLFFGDGGGFGGDNERGRASFGIAMITGEPPPTIATMHNVYGGYQSAHAAQVTGKASALIAIGEDFYAIAGIYRPTDPKSAYPHEPSGSPNHLEIASSFGNAYSWHDGEWTFCGVESEHHARVVSGSFCPQGFVSYGAGNAGAMDDYVYVFGMDAESYWSDIPTTLPVNTYLARVPRTRLLAQSAYEYFAGLDRNGDPVWRARTEQMRPVFTDRNVTLPGCHGGCPMAAPIEEAVYIAPLQRYIAVAQGNYAAQTSFYESPNPWGPWSVISYNNIDPATGSGGWANLGAVAGESLGVHLVNAWTSASGHTLWATYSSDGRAPADALFPPASTAMDSFNLVPVELEMKTTR